MKITTAQLRKIIEETVAAELQNAKQTMTEGHARITAEEVEAWKKGDWGYVAGDEPAQDYGMMDMDSMEDPNRFLHGKEPHDDEGSMVKSRLHSMKDMAKDVCDILKAEDQLPGWVQDHISVAHENLQQVHGYLMGQQHATEHGHEDFASDEMAMVDVNESEKASETSENLFEGTFDLKAYLKG